MTGIEFWDVKYRENAPALLAAIRRYIPDLDLARDLMHEAFCTAIHKYDSFDGKGSFDGWLYRIAVNTALMYLRSNKGKFTSVEALDMVAEEETDRTPENDHDIRSVIETAGFSTGELLSAVDCLPVHHRMVFNMYVMDNFSHKQIAAELQISPGTSKSHLARARKKIQQHLYENALDKKRKTNRKRAALLLLFPAKTHFIDKLYRNKMTGFKIPSDDSGLLPSTLEEAVVQSSVSAGGTATAAHVASTAAFWGSKLSYVVMCCGTAAITTGVCYVAFDGQTAQEYVRKELPAAVDSISYFPLTEGDSPVNEVNNRQEPESPVIEEEKLESDQNLPQNNRAFPGKKEKEQENLPDRQKPDPVVVKRTVIEKKTIVVRDTIIIRE